MDSMGALRNLPLSRYEVRTVLLPRRDRGKGVGEAVEIIVFGANFPIRAVQPEILVGGQVADRVEVALNQQSIRGYLWSTPRKGAVIRVRYGDSQEGVLEHRFEPSKIKPLPRGCVQ